MTTVVDRVQHNIATTHVVDNIDQVVHFCACTLVILLCSMAATKTMFEIDTAIATNIMISVINSLIIHLVFIELAFFC